ncbi:MAG: TatD family hydrolase [Rickettsiales bacterium]|jgi:TatD DNase family protein|nr:TatD family hydrolase [Rickettsiales bacterium]
MLIDTHTHVPNLDGVDKIILSSADPKNIDTVFEVARGNPYIFCTIGIHPEYHDAVPNYERLLSNPKVVGIGEIGLDYHYGDENKKMQTDLFSKQLEIARRAGLPVAVHSRDAENDTIKILHGVRGVMHCFTSSYDFARIMLDRGFFISASGIITFKNSADLRDTFGKIPLDRIVAETDSPWCAPVPYRGRECAPSMIIETVKCLAEIKQIPPVEMERILWDNSHALYGKLCQDN